MFKIGSGQVWWLLKWLQLSLQQLLSETEKGSFTLFIPYSAVQLLHCLYRAVRYSCYTVYTVHCGTAVTLFIPCSAVQLLHCLYRAVLYSCYTVYTVLFGTAFTLFIPCSAVQLLHCLYRAVPYSCYTVYTAQCVTAVSLNTNQINYQFQITIDLPLSGGTNTPLCETVFGSYYINPSIMYNVTEVA